MGKVLVLASVLVLHLYLPAETLGGSLNKTCQLVDDCDPYGYFCGRETCLCLPGYVENKTTKTCLGGVDQKCMYDENCIVGAFCQRQEKCKCKIKFVPSENGLECVENSASANMKGFQGILLIILLLIYSKML